MTLRAFLTSLVVAPLAGFVPKPKRIAASNDWMLREAEAVRQSVIDLSKRLYKIRRTPRVYCDWLDFVPPIETRLTEQSISRNATGMNGRRSKLR